MADGVLARPRQPIAAETDRSPTAVTSPVIPRPLWFGGLAVAWLEVAWATRTAGFFQDDFIFLGQGRVAGVSGGEVVPTRLSWDYLSEALFEHFSPVTRFLFWFVGRFDDPLLAVRVTVLAIVAAVILGFAEVSRTILGRTVPALLLAMIASQALVLTRLGAWTTACFNILPAVAASAFSLALAMRYLGDHRRRLLAVASVMLYGLACLDYELAMIIPAFLGLWVVLCGPEPRTVRGVGDLLRRTWVFWAALLVIGLASLANYRFNYYLDTIPRGTIGSTLRTLWYAAWQGLFPAVLGIWSPVAGDFGVGPFVALAVWVVLVGLALRTAGRRVVPALLLAPSGWLVFTGLLGYARSAVNTTGIGIELYYAAFPLLILLIGSAEVVRCCIEARSVDRAVSLVLAVLVVAGAVMLQVNARDIAAIKGVASAARSYERNFIDDVDEAGGAVAVVSTRTPGQVVYAAFSPFDWASRNVGELTPDVLWNDLSTGDLHRIDFASGRLVPVELTAETPGTVVDHPGVSTAIFVPDEPGCYLFEAGTEVLQFAFDPPTEVAAGAVLVVALRGSASQPTAFTLRTTSAEGSRPTHGDLDEWPEGEFATVHAVDATSLASIEITGVRPGTTLCLDPPVAATLADR